MTGDLLTRGIAEIIGQDAIEIAVSTGKKLRVKLGIDPTAPDLHLGHAVVLKKLREFQDAGHQAVLIIGDFTAMIGDPTGKSEARPPLTAENVAGNMKDFLAQAGKILDVEKLEVRHNSEWLGQQSNMAFVLELLRGATMQQMLHRADFKKRIAAGEDITFAELMYPILQGYDSVAVQADVELGGTDQKFNLLVGRRVQRSFDVPEQNIVMVPLLIGLDGERKMSKSLGNYIGIADDADTMFGKVMSTPDAIMGQYFTLLTDIPMPSGMKPRDAKILLATTITDAYHGAGAGERAAAAFAKKFSGKELPTDAPDLEIPDKDISLIDLVLLAGASSKSEARRLIEQGGVKIDGTAHTDPDAKPHIKGGLVLQIGKLKAFTLRVK